MLDLQPTVNKDKENEKGVENDEKEKEAGEKQTKEDKKANDYFADLAFTDVSVVRPRSSSSIASSSSITSSSSTISSSSSSEDASKMENKKTSVKVCSYSCSCFFVFFLYLGKHQVFTLFLSLSFLFLNV